MDLPASCGYTDFEPTGGTRTHDPESTALVPGCSAVTSFGHHHHGEPPQRTVDRNHRDPAEPLSTTTLPSPRSPSLRPLFLFLSGPSDFFSPARSPPDWTVGSQATRGGFPIGRALSGDPIAVRDSSGGRGEHLSGPSPLRGIPPSSGDVPPDWRERGVRRSRFTHLAEVSWESRPLCVIGQGVESELRR